MKPYIRDIQTFTTAPDGVNLVVVKIITNEKDLFGLGCATFTQRYLLVVEAVEQYLKPFLIGKEVDRIEDLWQTSMVSSYWRNGPVLNNAISGIDMALWDIKGKRAGMPLYELFGGKCREAAKAYTHVNGNTIDETISAAKVLTGQGYRALRLQCGGYGGTNQKIIKPENSQTGVYFSQNQYMEDTLSLFKRARRELGTEIELCHDVHERLTGNQAMNFAKAMESFNLFFLEDIVSPEQIGWLRNIRQLCSTPLAIGELFVNSNEWLGIISERLIDYIRVHLSMIGGITPARKLIALSEAFGVGTAWHCPNDITPIGVACNIHLDLSCPNFGIQEWAVPGDNLTKVFPGMPEVRNGYIYVNDKPGIGVEFDENLAALYPCENTLPTWTLTRLPDGTSFRP